jgi:hypothetical protein
LQEAIEEHTSCWGEQVNFAEQMTALGQDERRQMSRNPVKSRNTRLAKRTLKYGRTDAEYPNRNNGTAFYLRDGPQTSHLTLWSPKVCARQDYSYRSVFGLQTAAKRKKYKDTLELTFRFTVLLCHENGTAHIPAKFKNKKTLILREENHRTLRGQPSPSKNQQRQPPKGTRTIFYLNPRYCIRVWARLIFKKSTFGHIGVVDTQLLERDRKIDRQTDRQQPDQIATKPQESFKKRAKSLRNYTKFSTSNEPSWEGEQAYLVIRTPHEVIETNAATKARENKLPHVTMRRATTLQRRAAFSHSLSLSAQSNRWRQEARLFWPLNSRCQST